MKEANSKLEMRFKSNAGILMQSVVATLILLANLDQQLCRGKLRAIGWNDTCTS